MIGAMGIPLTKYDGQEIFIWVDTEFCMLNHGFIWNNSFSLTEGIGR